METDLIIGWIFGSLNIIKEAEQEHMPALITKLHDELQEWIRRTYYAKRVD